MKTASIIALAATMAPHTLAQTIRSPDIAHGMWASQTSSCMVLDNSGPNVTFSYYGDVYGDQSDAEMETCLDSFPIVGDFVNTVNCAVRTFTITSEEARPLLKGLTKGGMGAALEILDSFLIDDLVKLLQNDMLKEIAQFVSCLIPSAFSSLPVPVADALDLILKGDTLTKAEVGEAIGIFTTFMLFDSYSGDIETVDYMRCPAQDQISTTSYVMPFFNAFNTGCLCSDSSDDGRKAFDEAIAELIGNNAADANKLVDDAYAFLMKMINTGFKWEAFHTGVCNVVRPSPAIATCEIPMASDKAGMATFVNEMLFDTQQAECRAAKTMICDAQPTKPQRDMLPLIQNVRSGLLNNLKEFNFTRFVEIAFDMWGTLYTTCGSAYVEVPKFDGTDGTDGTDGNNDTGAASQVTASSMLAAVAVLAALNGQR